MLVGRDDLPQRRGKHPRVRILFLHLRDHALERFNLGGQIFSARFGALEAEAKLEILLVADEHVGQRRDLTERLGEFLLTAFPERGAVVKVEGDERTVLLRGLCQRKAALRCLMAHSRDEAGQVQDSDALLTEDALHVKIFDRKCPTNFTSTVIPETRRAQTKAGVGDVKLVPIAPRPALLHVQPLKADVPRAELALDEVRDGAALDEFREREALVAKARRNVQHVRLRAGRLHIKQVAVLYRHPLRRRDAHTHARRARNGILIGFLHRVLSLIRLNHQRPGARIRPLCMLGVRTYLASGLLMVAFDLTAIIPK